MKKHILVIEDNFDVRDNIEEILELANYEVTTAENGKIGVAKAQANIPDLIICDIMMPELDGYGVLYLLGKNPETAGVPFIFLSAKADKQDLRKGMNLGADDYLTKPFEEMDLLNAIEIRLKKNEAFKKDFSGGEDGINSFINEARAVAALEELSENRKTRTYKKKEMVYLEGNYPNALYFIVKGKVKTYKTNEEGKDLIIGIHDEGEFIGYLPLLKDCDYQDSAMVMEETTITVISKDDFNHLLHTNRDVSHKFIKMLSGDLMEKEEELIKLAYNTVRKRVAEGLLKISSKYDNPETEAFPAPREDLANIVGTAPESVIRVLSDFKEEGLIVTEGRKIKITNKEGLGNIRY